MSSKSLEPRIKSVPTSFPADDSPVADYVRHNPGRTVGVRVRYLGNLASTSGKYCMSFAITLLLVSLIVFMTTEFSPGQAARKILGQFATDEQVTLLTTELGLDRPVVLRYAEYVSNFLQGDLGYSQRFKTDVNAVLWNRLANTALLAAICFGLIVPTSIFFGAIAGMREGSFLDRSIMILSTTAASVPEFALGVFLASVFVVWLEWLPWVAIGDSNGMTASQMVLPVAVVVLYVSGYLINIVRASMVEVMQQPFVRTAILKGMSIRRAMLKHALRNAIITPMAVMFLQLNYLISGLVVVETVFAYPGFGRMMLEAALFKDVALLQAGALVAVSVAIVSQLLSDITQRALDPRASL